LNSKPKLFIKIRALGDHRAPKGAGGVAKSCDEGPPLGQRGGAIRVHGNIRSERRLT